MAGPHLEGRAIVSDSFGHRPLGRQFQPGRPIHFAREPHGWLRAFHGPFLKGCAEPLPLFLATMVQANHPAKKVGWPAQVKYTKFCHPWMRHAQSVRSDLARTGCQFPNRGYPDCFANSRWSLIGLSVDLDEVGIPSRYL